LSYSSLNILAKNLYLQLFIRVYLLLVIITLITRLQNDAKLLILEIIFKRLKTFCIFEVSISRRLINIQMNKLFKLHLILAFLLWTTTVVGQNYTLSYRVLDNEDGLLGSRVNSYHEDKYGFVWLSTQHGIGRYDGHQFKWFTIINSNLRGIPEGDAAPLVEDDEGYLWLLSAGQIDIINTQTLEIQALEDRVKEALPFTGEIKDIKVSKDNYIFIKVSGNKWYSYHSSTGFKDLGFKKTRYNFQLQGDKYWLLDDDKLKAYNYKSNQMIDEFPYKNKPVLKVISNYNGERMLFWRFVNNNIIEILEYKNSKLEKVYEYKMSNPLRLRFIFIMYLPSSNIFVTNFNVKNQGLTIIDLEHQRLIPIKNSNHEIIKKVDGRWISEQEVIWARSKRSIALLKIQKTNFHQYLPGFSLRGLHVSDEYLFANKYKVNLVNQDKVEIEVGKGSIWGVEQNLKNELWVGSNNGVTQLSAAKNTILKSIPSRFGRPFFWTILKSKEGQWWTGTYIKGLFISNSPKNDSLFLYQKYNGFEELRDVRVNHLLEDGNYIWASTPIGLYLIHKEKGILKKYNSVAPAISRLPVNHTHFLYKDEAGTYWLTTNSEGLVRFKVNQDFEIIEYKRYTVKDGLASNVLYSIIEDEKKRLWISTLNGISCFDKKRETILSFDKGDGIFELEFNRNSYTKAADGRIYFGSISGATAFYPDEIVKSDDYDFPIHIIQFITYQKDDKLVDQTKQVLQSKKIVIQPTERFFRLNVAMLDIYNSNQIKYSYKIEGLFDKFQQIDGNTIEIGGLPYGRYTLRVRGQGGDKRFSKQELTIPLIIVHPFYLKWWFITIAILVLMASILQVYQWRIRQLKERKEELEILVTERTAQIRKDKTIIEEQAMQLKELDELKSKFFANISHELRTPLTLLLAPMESISKSNQLSNKNFTYLQMMRQNGKKLLKRINELLDLSRLDANKLEVNEAATFLYPFAKTILSTFESAANLKGIQLLFKYQLDENIQIKLDDDKVEKIVANFLSNALKFTPKQGEIELDISKKSDKLLISVRDTGIGILPNDLIKVFDRFYQSRDASPNRLHLQGTGIGLSLCRELAKVLGGRVWATSEIGKGSIFYLELPFVETFAIKELVEEEEILIPTLPNVAEMLNPTAQKLRPNILIVEDNPDLRNYLSMILEEDYNVEIAENGQEALERLTDVRSSLDDGRTLVPRSTDNNTPIQSRQAKRPSAVNRLPSLIISDIMMPVMDGIQLLEKVKNTKALQHIPMIMLTARQSLEVKLEVLRIGVDDYLTKPFREEELKARVANLIKNSENRHTQENSISSERQEFKTISAPDLVWLKEIESMLEKNMNDSNFKISDIASQMAVTPRRLQQKIKEITGLTPKQYQRSIRLNKARTILKSGQIQTVSEAMYQIGFENRNYFSKIYLEEFGIKPSQELK
jgi:signal transduction histidine kinase/CheY-like chemotaxis protein/ligand-binding sensor domain-containing protein